MDQYLQYATQQLETAHSKGLPCTTAQSTQLNAMSGTRQPSAVQIHLPEREVRIGASLGLGKQVEGHSH